MSPRARAAALVGAYSAVTLVISSLGAWAKPFWYDELHTFYLAQLPLGRLWSALAAGADQMPPLGFLASRAAQSVFGAGEWSTRLPEILGFWLAGLCLFAFVARRAGAEYGALAATFPLVTAARAYAYEARPYALVLGLGALALLSWQRAADSRRRPAWLAALWMSLALADCLHYYAGLLIVPLVLAEALRCRLARRVDWPMALALLSPALVLLAFLPLIRAGIAIGRENAWNAPEFMSLVHGYPLLLGYGGAAVLALAALACAARRGGSRRPAAPPLLNLPEMVAAWAFAGLPVAVFVAARLVTNMFHPRYGVAMVLGFSLLVAAAVHRAASGRRSVALAAAACFALFNLVTGVLVVPREFARGAALRYSLVESSRRLFGDLPIVVDCPLTFVEKWHYASPETRARLVYVADSESSLRYVGSDSSERQLTAAAGTVFPFQVERLSEFQAVNRRFLIYWEPWAAGWPLARWRKSGAHIKAVAGGKGPTLFLVEDFAK